MNLWYITENKFDATPKQLHSQETVFTIGNGYFCTRGTFEEGYPRHDSATLLFGVFDSVAIAKEELANVPDWTVIQLFVNGERFRFDRGKLLSYERTLNLHNGVLTRHAVWESKEGIRIRIKTERFASLADEHLGVIRYQLTVEATPDGRPATVSLRSTFNTAQGNYDVMHWETIDQGEQGNVLWLQSETKKSRVQLVQTMSFTADMPAFRTETIESDVAPGYHLEGNLAAGETVTAEKVVTMFTSRDGFQNLTETALRRHETVLESSSSDTVYDALLVNSEKEWNQFWDVADVILEGDEKAQIGLRYSLYQLRINSSSHDPRYSIAAKGLTGFGYRGHVFHDTEIFMLPFFTYVLPEVARNLLLYRYYQLPAARRKAASHGYDGAQYPWESTLNGDETTPPTIIHPETGELIPVLNGFIELHITASIAHAVWEYWRITGDNEFMRDYGTEMLLNTAQFWVSRLEKNEQMDRYEITDVIGPDEWHEHVDNNAFTNSMVKRNIQRAVQAFQWLSEYDSQKAKELQEKLSVNKQLLAIWQEIQDKIFVPQDPQTGVFEQFDGFFALPYLDQSLYKGRHDSYQGIMGVREVQHYQIIKQADVLMLLTVAKEDFDRKTIEANWNYYYPVTDHDYGSSLTPALHVILANELGHKEEAYKLFMKGALVDLENLRGNTPEGIHTACAGAVWQAAVLGIAGLRVTEQGYTTNPIWVNNWTRLAFRFWHKGELVTVDLRR